MKIVEALIESGAINGNPYYTNAVDLVEQTDDKQLELMNAVVVGNAQETERLLKEFDVAAPRDENSIRRTFDNKNQATQKLLLQYKSLPFTAHNNLILRLAGKRQNYQVMKMLLSDPEVVEMVGDDVDSYSAIAKDIKIVASMIGVKI